MNPTVYVTGEEQKAIRSMQRLAKKWPRSLWLFSWSGSLQIMKERPDGILVPLESVKGIPNDGGDPGSETVDVYNQTEIVFEED